MKWLIWITTGVLLALWTLGVWAAAAVSSWALGWIGGAESADWPAVVASISLPGWVTLWFDPGWISAAIEAVLRALEGLQLSLPWVASMAGWVVAALWVTWAIGALVLLALGGGTHWLVARHTAPSQPAAA